MSLFRWLTGASGVAFLIYGVLCFTSQFMLNDFHRFGLERLRLLTGVLELLGGAGLLIGLAWLPALQMSSAGLSLLMLIAFAVRVHMRDGVALSSPSLFLTIVNLYIFVKATQNAHLYQQA